MTQHQKNVRSNKSSKSSKGENTSSSRDVKPKRAARPTEPLNPEEEKIRPTLVKVCAYIEWMAQELQELREELEAKPELSEHNTLSFKVDQLDGAINDLSNRLDDIDE